MTIIEAVLLQLQLHIGYYVSHRSPLITVTPYSLLLRGETGLGYHPLVLIHGLDNIIDTDTDTESERSAHYGARLRAWLANASVL